MSWSEVATYIGTGLTGIGTFFSLASWYKSRDYYRKITLIEYVEKIDEAIKDIVCCKKQYNQILSIFGNGRGSEGTDTIKKKFMTIKSHLHNIEDVLPHKYREIHEACKKPVEYVDKIIGGVCKCVNSQEFKMLQSQITAIQDQLKFTRDELRGIK